MTRAVRDSALDTVEPPLARAVHDGGWLSVVHSHRGALRGRDLLERGAVFDRDHVPAMHRKQFRGVSLHVITGLVAFARHAVGIDRRLIPLDVNDDVVQPRGARERECF